MLTYRRYASLLNTQGQALLDLSLYVSSANYSAITRPVYSTITTFPLSWLRPHRQRSHAKSRTAHLGLSSLDVDAEEREAKEKSADSPVPQSLRKATTSITASLFASPEDAARIRLDALASDFFDPLAELFANKRFFLPGAVPTSLDCLALAYLALALFPDLPSPWLRTCLQSRYPGLCKFVHDTQRVFFGGPVTVVDAGLVPGQMEVAGGGCTGEGQKVVSVGYLPWAKEGSHDSWGVVRALFGQAADSLPVVREWREGRRLEYVERNSEEEGAEGTIVGRPRGLGVAGVVVGVLAGMGAMAGLVFYHGPIFKALGMRPPQKRIQAQPQPQTSRYPSYGGVEPGVARLAAQMDSFGR
jgi:sorting and assembly machinery component 37